MSESGRTHPWHAPLVESCDAQAIIFLTTCTKDRQRVLADGSAHALLLSAWASADLWQVGRYVIMPDHVHLFCAPARQDACSLQTWVSYWKSMVARRWSDPTVKLWQRSSWDTQLRRAESYDSKWEYVVNNPVRASLVEIAADWPYQGEVHRLRW